MLKPVVFAVLAGLVVAPAFSGESYDDREVMKRTLDLTVAIYNALPQPPQCIASVDRFEKDPIKGQMTELRSISKTLRAAGKSEGTDEIRQLRASIADKATTLTSAIAAYSTSAVSYASSSAQLKAHEKTKPTC